MGSHLSYLPLRSFITHSVTRLLGRLLGSGREDTEIIFLNDFWWHPKIIAWADFPQALEGDTVHLPAPKNVCTRDLELNKDTPFFVTSDAPLVVIKEGAIDTTNTTMMRVGWVHFYFWKQIAQGEQQELIPCSCCFAKFILENTAQIVRDMLIYNVCLLWEISWQHFSPKKSNV